MWVLSNWKESQKANMSSKVILDGETVTFEGPSPSTCGEVWTLLEDHLGQAGILIDRFLVDGVAWSPDSENNQVVYSIIEVFTVTFEQNVAHIVEALLKEGEELQEQWKLGASKSLSKPWSQFQPEAVRILNETQPLVQSIGLLAEYSKQNQKQWSNEISRLGEKINVVLSSLMDAIEAGDCVTFSDFAGSKLCATLAEVYKLLSIAVLPSLGELRADG